LNLILLLIHLHNYQERAAAVRNDANGSELAQHRTGDDQSPLTAGGSTQNLDVDIPLKAGELPGK
jgi:hypothetical protein